LGTAAGGRCSSAGGRGASSTGYSQRLSASSSDTAGSGLRRTSSPWLQGRDRTGGRNRTDATPPIPPLHLLGAIAFALAFGLLGYFAGAAAVNLVERFGAYAALALAALALAAALTYWRVRRRPAPA